MSYNRYNDFPQYVSKSERIKRAEKAREKLSKKSGVSLEPVEVSGRQIAKSWWGKQWNSNLERYSDYAYRLDRGRSYVRSGSVIDLKIKAGEISALVMGSNPRPYKINIRIDMLKKINYVNLLEMSKNALDSMQALLNGEFPSELKDAFFTKNTGLFPSPGEIRFNCDCPDIATMCKHVASVMYGISVRLDQKPELFFLLRGIDVGEFVNVLIDKEKDSILSRATMKTERKLAGENDELSELFGIDLGDGSTDHEPFESVHDSKDDSTQGTEIKPVAKKKTVKKTKKKVVKKAVKKVVKKDVKKAVKKKLEEKTVAKKVTRSK